MANTRRAKPAGGKPKPTAMEIITSAKLPEKTVPICMRGDLVAEMEDLERQMTAAGRPNDGRLTGNTDAKKLAEQLESLQEQMQESTIVFRLRAMHRSEWPKLVAAHPPRKDNMGDRALEINEETFFDALIRKSVVEPELDEETLTAALDAMTHNQFDRLASAAWNLNRKDVDVPFSALALASLRNSGEE